MRPVSVSDLRKNEGPAHTGPPLDCQSELELPEGELGDAFKAS